MSSHKQFRDTDYHPRYDDFLSPMAPQGSYVGVQSMGPVEWKAREKAMKKYTKVMSKYLPPTPFGIPANPEGRGLKYYPKGYNYAAMHPKIAHEYPTEEYGYGMAEARNGCSSSGISARGMSARGLYARGISARGYIKPVGRLVYGQPETTPPSTAEALKVKYHKAIAKGMPVDKVRRRYLKYKAARGFDIHIDEHNEPVHIEDVGLPNETEGGALGIAASLIGSLAVPLIKEGVSWIADKIKKRREAKGKGISKKYFTHEMPTDAEIKSIVQKKLSKMTKFDKPAIIHAYKLAKQIIPKHLPKGKGIVKNVSDFITRHKAAIGAVKNLIGTKTAMMPHSIADIMRWFINHPALLTAVEHRFPDMARGEGLADIIHNVINSKFWTSDLAKELGGVGIDVGKRMLAFLGSTLVAAYGKKPKKEDKPPKKEEKPPKKEEKKPAKGGDVSADVVDPTENFTVKIQDDATPTTAELSMMYATPYAAGPSSGDSFRYGGLNANLVYEFAKKTDGT